MTTGNSLLLSNSFADDEARRLFPEAIIMRD